jgi:antitoxin (DNA-binding transcriptional repressor) of toxin-antitoxin stability system
VSRTINAKQLRAQLAEIVAGVRRGDRFTVLYRSRPAFDIVAVGSLPAGALPLQTDALYQAPPVGTSADGSVAEHHDQVLYR